MKIKLQQGSAAYLYVLPDTSICSICYLCGTEGKLWTTFSPNCNLTTFIVGTAQNRHNFTTKVPTLTLCTQVRYWILCDHITFTVLSSLLTGELGYSSVGTNGKSQIISEQREDFLPDAVSEACLLKYHLPHIVNVCYYMRVQACLCRVLAVIMH